MTEELETLLDVVSRLDEAGILYMISGAMAMNYYAVPRMTRDIDIVVDMRSGDAERITELLEGSYFLDLDSAKEAVSRRRMFNVIHKVKMIKVDFVVRKDLPYREEEFNRRRQAEVEGKKFWIVAPEDLLLSKLFWAKDSHSELQLRDARNLLASVSMDVAYLDRWAAVLGVANLLDEVRK